MRIIAKPDNGEFFPNEPLYAKVIPDDGQLLRHLETNLNATRKFVLSIPKEKMTFRYAEGKWTISEVMMHLVDLERIYTYRALRFARNDKTVLPGFDDKTFAFYSNANAREISHILSEFEAVRKSTIALFDGLDDEALLRKGTANGNPVSVRALAYHIAGHELHHVNIIKERYLD
jgi:uncharacterized damage-inducible protein DinB